jgi:hypothetical protein
MELWRMPMELELCLNIRTVSLVPVSHVYPDWGIQPRFDFEARIENIYFLLTMQTQSDIDI